MEVSGLLLAPAALSPSPQVPTRLEEPVWTLWKREKSCPCQESNLGCPSHALMLYWLSYFGFDVSHTSLDLQPINQSSLFSEMSGRCWGYSSSPRKNGPPLHAPQAVMLNIFPQTPWPFVYSNISGNHETNFARKKCFALVHTVDSIGFWRWCITHRITGFSDSYHPDSK
jgi:hypothetical protein